MRHPEWAAVGALAHPIPSADATLALTLAVYEQALKDEDHPWLRDPGAQEHWRTILVALWAATVLESE